MISETGNNSGFTPLEIGCRRQPSVVCGIPSLTGFTFIEVMLAVSILATGMLGVLGAYKALLNALQASQYSVEGSYALKEKISDIEKEEIEKSGVRPGYRQGAFREDYPDFFWEEEIEATALCRYDEEAGHKDCLNKVKITVTNEAAKPARRLSLVTYMENYEQDGGE